MKQHTLEVYESKKVKGQWGWRLKAPNGRKVACSGELYKDKTHAYKMATEIAGRMEGCYLDVLPGGKSVYKLGRATKYKGKNAKVLGRGYHGDVYIKIGSATNLVNPLHLT